MLRRGMPRKSIGTLPVSLVLSAPAHDSISILYRPQLGYALGKITEYEVEGQLPFQQITAPKSFVGHVASIAVHERYRGFGVAKELMTCLHYNFAKHYHMDRVSLYVRVRLSSSYVVMYCFASLVDGGVSRSRLYMHL